MLVFQVVFVKEIIPRSSVETIRLKSIYQRN